MLAAQMVAVRDEAGHGAMRGPANGIVQSGFTCCRVRSPASEAVASCCTVESNNPVVGPGVRQPCYRPALPLFQARLYHAGGPATFKARIRAARDSEGNAAHCPRQPEAARFASTSFQHPAPGHSISYVSVATVAYSESLSDTEKRSIARNRRPFEQLRPERWYLFSSFHPPACQHQAFASRSSDVHTNPSRKERNQHT